jgi:hypothetical protein
MVMTQQARLSGLINMPLRMPTVSYEVDSTTVPGDLLARANIIDRITQDICMRSITNQQANANLLGVLGIYGTWGSGKSTLMRLVIEYLKKRNADPANDFIACCLYSPWKYEIEGEVAFGLIKALRDFQRDNLMGHWRIVDLEGIKRQAGSVLKHIGDIASSSNHPVVNATGTAASYYARMMRGEDDVVEIQTEMNKLVKKITTSISKANGNRPTHLVVFIDDLDRCAPHNLVHLFEWLKLHLRAENCTYVIALDHDAAARAIVGEYKNHLGENVDIAYGYRYLEKLVTNEYEVAQTTKAEEMAIRQIFPPDFPYTNLEDIARWAVGGDFPGVTNIHYLMELRALRIPRTMLKIVYRFGTSLQNIARGQNSLQNHRGSEQQNENLLDLRDDYAFWLLFLIAVYYRLDPDALTDFTDGNSPLFEVFSGGEWDAILEGLKDTAWVKEGPRKEFLEFAHKTKLRSGSALQPPVPHSLRLLAKIIRENALPTEQFK